MVRKYSPGTPSRDLDLAREYRKARNPKVVSEIRAQLNSAVSYYENKRETTANSKAKRTYTQVLDEISESIRVGDKKHGGVESKVAASIFVVSIIVLIIGFILSSFNITGFAINESYTVSNWTGGFLFILGILGIVFSVNRR